jgi:hypothetical protein
MKRIRSVKIEIIIENKKIQDFIEKIIKEYKLKKDDGDYSIENKKFILFNNNQYRFTEIRNEVFRKKIKYEEFEETITM